MQDFQQQSGTPVPPMQQAAPSPTPVEAPEGGNEDDDEDDAEEDSMEDIMEDMADSLDEISESLKTLVHMFQKKGW